MQALTAREVGATQAPRRVTKPTAVLKCGAGTPLRASTGNRTRATSLPRMRSATSLLRQVAVPLQLSLYAMAGAANRAHAQSTGFPPGLWPVRTTPPEGVRVMHSRAPAGNRTRARTLARCCPTTGLLGQTRAAPAQPDGNRTQLTTRWRPCAWPLRGTGDSNSAHQVGSLTLCQMS